MIFIVVKFKVLAQHSDSWLNQLTEFTTATRSEPGNLWFEWSIAADDPNEFVLVEAFADAQAGSEHVQSDHFRNGLETMRPLLKETPKIINTVIDQKGWSKMDELAV
ncbi:putative quinol monooxygenase [Rhodococcus sp. I2R]|uniref:putative quinol monooxygenase n=1 Tax=Rhodococcus sp. I2R TaxID=2855445 RepID=UPI000963A206|nr:putative quinol monooxygenase [Rhodococcus sp. I2R]MCC8926965.1 antibiotic biosynthesis monooxygenase [Rhodococcus sp. I2R]OLT35971.1 antibiotic biosynthesis monooxygenase [Rhodococcus sp. CUA-806]